MKKKWLAWCFQWKANILAILLIAVAFVLTLSRVLVIVLAHHPVFVEKWLSIALKRSVQIESIQADWAVLDPGIRFKNVVLKNRDQQSFVQIKKLTLSIHIIRSLFHWKLLPGRLTIEGVDLDVNNENNHLKVRGIFSSSENNQLLGHAAAFKDLINWILAEGNVDIKNVNVSYHSKGGETYFLHNVHLRIKNSFFQHRIDGGAKLNENHVLPTEIRFAAKLDDIDFSDAKFNANIYVQFRDIQLAQWAHSPWLKPYIKKINIRDGSGNLELWASWRKTKITSLVGRWRLKNAEILLTQQKHQKIPGLSHTAKDSQEEESLLPNNQKLDINAMSANFIWNSSSNEIDWDAKTIIFSLPDAYHEPLLLKDLKMRLIWSKDENGLHLYVPVYQCRLFGLETQGSFNMTLPTVGKPTIDILSQCRFKHFSQLSQLFSSDDSASSFNKWLRQAFLKGSLKDATIAYHGPIEKHPFQDHAAHLSAELQVRNLSLSYYFNWPVLSKLNANIEVSDRKINATFLNAYLDNNSIKKLQISVNDFLHPVLTISGDLHSNVAHIYQFIQNSPIASKKGPSLFPLQGPINLNFLLCIDFSKPGFPVQSKGVVDLMGSLLKFNLQVTDSIAHINFNGNLNVTTLSQQSSNNLLKGISGNTNFQASLDINRSKDRAKKLDIALNADMQGITISGFPKFIDKKNNVINPLKLHITQYWKKPIEITLQYRDDIFMHLLAANKQDHLKLLSGEIDVGEKLFPEHSIFPGFVIYGKMAYFHWEAWKPFIMPFIHEKDGAIDIPEIFGLPLRYVELQFKKLNAYHLLIDDMNFKLIPRKHDWMFEMNSPKIAGTFFIPNYSGGTWAGHLDHLFVPKLTSKKTKKKRKIFKVNPRDIPPIDIEIKHLHYGIADYGRFELRTRPIKKGISINTFSINTPLFMLQMKGKWLQLHHHELTRLSGYFKTRDLGQLLQSWDIKNTLAHGHGIAKFHLSWPNALNRIQSRILNGSIIFDFRRGRILKMNKNKSTELSLGRILNAFSIEDLPRRLMLNFSDITAKGLEFHVLKGKVNINRGICKTKDTILDSPVAKLKISGVINFPGKYYDLNVSVAPYVTSSLPLIVGIAGGPIAGAIAWVANKIATPEIGKMMGFVYHAKGSWDQSKDQKLPLPAETHTSHIKNIT